MLIFIALASYITLPLPAFCDPPGRTRPTKLFGSLDEVATACAAAGFVLSRNAFPARIEKVSLGSAACYAGLRANDNVLAGKLESDRLVIDFERGGRTYRVKVATTPLRAMAPKSDKSSIPDLPVNQTDPPESPVKDPDKLTAHIDDPDAHVLSKYDIVLVIDRSGSMGGFKWEWCQNETKSLADALGKVAKTLTIVTFNSTFDIERNCGPKRVEDVFMQVTPSGGTNASAPLDAIFRETAGGKNPRLIAVLTDGLPNEGRPLQDVLIDATNSLSNQNQLTVTFLEIGTSFQGDAFLKALDDNLVDAGAKYDVVDTKTFDVLQRIGLKKALVDSLQERKSAATAGGDTKTAKTALDAELKKVTEELAKLRNK